jgi:hypothetical protein
MYFINLDKVEPRIAIHRSEISVTTKGYEAKFTGYPNKLFLEKLNQKLLGEKIDLLAYCHGYRLPYESWETLETKLHEFTLRNSQGEIVEVEFALLFLKNDNQ